MNSTSSQEHVGNSSRKLLLAITTFAKLGFGTFFIAGSVYYQSPYTGLHTALNDFCKSIGETYYDYHFQETFGDWRCMNDIIGGLYIVGSIFLLSSIVLEAFEPIVKRSIYRTIFHFIGGIFIMLASISDMLWRHEMWYEYDHPNFMPGCWITGGLLSALCQAHLIYCHSSRGGLTISTFLLAMMGSTLFMMFGIFRIYEVAVELIGYYGSDDDYKDYLNMSSGVLISACVLYILHSLLYPFAINKMNQDQDESGSIYSNPNVYQQFPIKPLNSSLDEDKDVSAV